jgi:ribosomal protein L11 methylase PrmA
MTAVEPGSFRDPSGQVFENDGRIFRTITARALADYTFVRDSGVLRRLVAGGRLVAAEEVDPALLPALLGEGARGAPIVVEHPRIPFVSYPYEWPFPALKAAALFHLDLQIELLADNVMLSDASAYNVQFIGPRPVLIDLLSLRRYREGEYWVGLRQFCEQFLNPLLLRAVLGVPHNQWYRGSLEGIPTSDLNRLLPFHKKLSWQVMTYVVLQARLEASANDKGTADAGAIRRKGLSKSSLLGILTQLRGWIEKLRPADTGKTVWGDYARNNTYTDAAEEAKCRFIAEFAEAVRPKLVWDLGCNSGNYSAVALGAGAQAGIGFDFDQKALELAFDRAVSEKLNLLPLFQDAANPSPDQGWKQAERRGIQGRGDADGLLALAFEHHLVIGRNVPLDQTIGWLTGLAPRGVIEFVPKDDPTVQRMLALREDIFDGYCVEAFTAALGATARIVREASIADSGRRLFWYDRS